MDALEQIGKMYHRNSVLQMWFWFPFRGGGKASHAAHMLPSDRRTNLLGLWQQTSRLYENTQVTVPMYKHTCQILCELNVFFFFVQLTSVPFLGKGVEIVGYGIRTKKSTVSSRLLLILICCSGFLVNIVSNREKKLDHWFSAHIKNPI